MDAEAIQREDDQLIINDVARGVEEHEFVPYVQPAFDLATGAVVGGEVLARWTLEDGVVVPAGAFVPSLERTRTICGLDWYIAEEVCALIQNAPGALASVPLSLNISTQHVDDPEFAKKFAATADWHEVAHEQLSVEIAAELIATDERVVSTLLPSVLKQGFSVVADNFCAGPEVLRGMQQKGIRVVKVAASLWRNGDSAQVRQVVDEAAKLGLTLIAENVENDEERQQVMEVGIEKAQGYGLAHPMGPDEFTALCNQ